MKSHIGERVASGFRPSQLNIGRNPEKSTFFCLLPMHLNKRVNALMQCPPPPPALHFSPSHFQTLDKEYAQVFCFFCFFLRTLLCSSISHSLFRRLHRKVRISPIVGSQINFLFRKRYQMSVVVAPSSRESQTPWTDRQIGMPQSDKMPLIALARRGD